MPAVGLVFQISDGSLCTKELFQETLAHWIRTDGYKVTSGCICFYVDSIIELVLVNFSPWKRNTSALFDPSVPARRATPRGAIVNGRF